MAFELQVDICAKPLKRKSVTNQSPIKKSKINLHPLLLSKMRNLLKPKKSLKLPNQVQAKVLTQKEKNKVLKMSQPMSPLTL